MVTLKHQFSVMTVKQMRLNPQGPFQGLVPNFIFIFLFLKNASQIVQASSPTKPGSVPGHGITLGEFSLSALTGPALAWHAEPLLWQQLSGHAQLTTRPHSEWNTISEGQEEASTWSWKSIKQAKAARGRRSWREDRGHEKTSYLPQK